MSSSGNERNNSSHKPTVESPLTPQSVIIGQVSGFPSPVQEEPREEQLDNNKKGGLTHEPVILDLSGMNHINSNNETEEHVYYYTSNDLMEDAGLINDSNSINILVHLRNIRDRISETPLLVLLRVILYVVLLLGGNATQVIALNFWVRQFPDNNSSEGFDNDNSGNYVVFVVSCFNFTLMFLLSTGLYFLFYCVYRKYRVSIYGNNGAIVSADELRSGSSIKLSFFFTRRSFYLILFIGLMDCLTSLLSNFAVSYTYAVLQTIFTAVSPIFATLFSKLLLNDKRDYRHNRLIWISFSCIAAGVFMAYFASLLATPPDAETSVAHRHSVLTHLCASGSAKVRKLYALFGLSSRSTGAAMLSNDDNGSKVVSQTEKNIWSLIFFLSVPLMVLMNVGQSVYMMLFTEEEEFNNFLLEKTGREVISYEEALAMAMRNGNSDTNNNDNNNLALDMRREEEEILQLNSNMIRPDSTPNLDDENGDNAPLLADNNNNNSNRASDANPIQLPPQSDDTTVKLVMLSSTTTVQLVAALLLFPVNVFPLFGSFSTLSEAFASFLAALHCVFFSCKDNFLFCFLYSLGFICIYAGSVYLNQYSVILCSMVTQLAGPLTALILLLFPLLDASVNDTNNDVISDDSWSSGSGSGDGGSAGVKSHGGFMFWGTISAIAALVFGTLVYLIWDEETAVEKDKNEREMKVKLLIPSERIFE